MEQEKKIANEIILSFKDFDVDLDLWMWKIPIKHKSKLFESLVSKKYLINQYI
jgi:hypothetical protein